MPSWAIIGGFILLGGAFGGLVGWWLERMGYGWGRYLAVMGSLFGLGISLYQGSTNNNGMVVTDPEIEAQIIATSPQLYSYLRMAYPKDFASFIATIRSVSTGEIAADQGAAFMQDFRRKHAPFLRVAPDDALEQLAKAQIEFFRTLHDNDPALCANVAYGGPAALMTDPSSDRYVEAMSDANLAFFKAARAGLDTPVVRREVTEADWMTLAAQMAADGQPSSFIASFNAPTPKDRRSCLPVLSLMRALNVPGERQGVIRAAFLTNSAAR